MSGTAQTLGLTPPDPATALGVDPTNPVPQMPGLGPLPGQLTLNPQIAPQVQGNARPLAPGEYLRNPDGGWSSEMTYTVPYGDGWAVIPGMWIVDGKPVHVDEDQATAYARQTGLNFPTYPDEATATKASEDREAGWQNMRPEDAGKVAPLWAKPMAEGGGNSGFVGTLDRIRPMQPTDRNMPTRIPGAPSAELGPQPDTAMEIQPAPFAPRSGYQAAGFVQPSDLQGVTPWDQSLPEQMRLAGGLTPQQMAQFTAAARAHSAAIQNQIREVPGGQSLIDGDLAERSPDAAAAYPAW